MSKRRPNLSIASYEREDGADLLVGVQAPGERRPSRHLQVVLDIGESMGPMKLFPALRGLHYLLGELSGKDTFGLVTIGKDAQVAFPAGPVTDLEELHEIFNGVRPFGPSEPTSGFLTAIRECQRIRAPKTAIVLISDSHLKCVTRGESHMIVGMAQACREQDFRVSTISMERKPNQLLTNIAQRGGGRSSQATRGSEVSAALATAHPDRGNTPIRSLSLTFRPSPDVIELRQLDSRPVVPGADGITVELGDMRYGETDRLAFELDIPDLAELGHAEVGEVELQWTDIRTASIESVKTAVKVNCPTDGSGGAPMVFETKMDLSRRKDPDGTSEPTRGPAGRPDQRRKRTHRALPASLKEQIAKTIQEQVRSEVERQLRENQPEQTDDPQTIRPDSADDDR